MVTIKEKPRVLVLRAAGTNCDSETAFAFEYVGARAERVHVNQLIKRERRLKDYHILAIPGGFTYGDDVASGKVLANELKYKLSAELDKFIKNGKLIIGICNGFQVLVKAGLLPGKGENGDEIKATLTVNDSAKYEDRWVYLSNVRSFDLHAQIKCVWARKINEIIYIPAAHGEGKFVPSDKDALDKLWMNGQIVFRYVDSKGKLAGFPWNPNGSVDGIAGICDITGRIFGLMPHPERHIFTTQHPRWTRGESKTEADGLRIFRNGVENV
ncbi:MAG: phosphoribosylformylglycinamidine synthase I [Candidatus Omnitrophota bacterium]